MKRKSLMLSLVKTILFSTSILLVQGCSAAIESDKELLIYVKKFESIYDAKYIYPIYFTKEFKSNTLYGVARVYYNSLGVVSGCQILINEDLWPSHSEYTKEVLVFHEIVHCLNYPRHDDSITDDGCPTSIMNRYNIGDTYCYKNKREYYLNELRNKL